MQKLALDNDLGSVKKVYFFFGSFWICACLLSKENIIIFDETHILNSQQSKEQNKRYRNHKTTDYILNILFLNRPSKKFLYNIYLSKKKMSVKVFLLISLFVLLASSTLIHDLELRKNTIFKQIKQNVNLTSNSNTWTQVPELKSEFFLVEESSLFVHYSVNVDTLGGEVYMVTRLMVDGVEQTEFRYITGKVRFIGNAQSGLIFLEAGPHTIQVQYRTPVTLNINPAYDWSSGTLSLKTLEKNILIE